MGNSIHTRMLCGGERLAIGLLALAMSLLSFGCSDTDEPTTSAAPEKPQFEVRFDQASGNL